MRTFILVLLVLLGASCSSSSSPTDEASGDVVARSNAPDTSDTDDSNSTQSVAAADSVPRIPRAGDPLTNADGSEGVFTEGMTLMIDDVRYVVQAADYNGPPVLAEERSSPAAPEIDLPPAPARLEAGVGRDQLVALFADIHGPTDSIVGELNRLAPFPAVLDSSGVVTITSHQVEINRSEEDELKVTAGATYETTDSMEFIALHHHEQMVAQGHEPREIEIEMENGVETKRSFDATLELDDLGRVWVTLYARPSQQSADMAAITLTARYDAPIDWPTFEHLLGWSGLDPLSDGPVTQLNYHSTTSDSGVVSAYTHTKWHAPESLQEATSIVAERADGFEASEHDSPDNRWLVSTGGPEISITAREHWRGSGTELVLYQSRPMLVVDERQITPVPSESQDEELDAVRELVSLRDMQAEYTPELELASSLSDVENLVYSVSNSQGDQSAIEQLNRLAPFPSTIEFPLSSQIWAVSLEASYVGGATRAQEIRYSAIVSAADQDSQQLYDLFIAEIADARATNVDETVTRTSDGVVEDAELSFVVERGGVLTNYDLEIDDGRFEIQVAYASLTEPDYVELLARNISVELPFDGPLAAASLATDQGALRFAVALSYDKEGDQAGADLFAGIISRIEETGTLTFEGPTSLRYDQSGADVRVDRDEWGMRWGTVTFTASPAQD